MQINSGRIHAVAGRCVLVVLFVACLLAGASREPEGGEAAEKIQLQFPVSFVPEQMWVYREVEGLDPPSKGIVFWLGRNPDGEGHFLATTGEELLEKKTFLQLVNQKMKANDSRLLYFGAVSPRDLFFHRIDLDGDGVDEVLLTGTGGVAGNAFLTIFQVRPAGVKKIYEGGSRFSLRIFDRDQDGTYEIANAGFAGVAQDELIGPKEFTIYALKQGSYVQTETMQAVAFARLEDRLRKQGRLNVPVTVEKRPVFALYPTLR